MDDLLGPLYDACKDPTAFRIGAEAEKIGVLEGSLAPLGYDGPRGVVSVMHELVASHGWKIADGSSPLLALEKADASVTLEPGAQFELSGAPHRDLHAIEREFRAHSAELNAVAEKLAPVMGERIAWLGIGFHPFAAQADLAWVPKPRYGIMRRYLPTRGDYGLDMMRRTATVQANFDYADEEHAMRCLRVGLRLAPFFTAQFASSPVYEGALFGGVSYRAKVWLSVDPDRQGLVPAVLKEKSRFSDYVDWALDAPMFVIIRDDEAIENTGQSFRSFMKHGFGPHRATLGDWVTHLNTLFPEVRLKRTLEVRGGDSLPKDLVVGPAALFTGIFYDARGLDAAEALTESFTHAELVDLRVKIVKDGPRAMFRGRPAGEVVQRAIDIASGGLERRGKADAAVGSGASDERRYLEPVTELAEALRCPADLIVDRIRAIEAEQKGGKKDPSGGSGPLRASEAVRRAILEICRL